MDNSTAMLGGCKECGQQLIRKAAGPLPTYCSGKCRAKAGARRAKADGRAQKWAEDAKIKRQTEKVIEVRPCPYCGDPMPRSHRVQCGKPECKRLWTNERHLAWQHQHKARTGSWYGQSFTYERTCIQCDKTWQARSNQAKYCSNRCQIDHEYGTDYLPKRALKRRRLLKKITKASQGTRGERSFVSGPCPSCGVIVTTRRSDIRWCSIACKTKQKSARRRARERDAFIEDVPSYQIFERDNWQCQLCGKDVDIEAIVPHPLAPTLDHIIPLARGGTHEAANTQCAHFICNSTKRDLITEPLPDLRIYKVL